MIEWTVIGTRWRVVLVASGRGGPSSPSRLRLSSSYRFDGRRRNTNRSNPYFFMRRLLLLRRKGG
jgi:hypothetical protein